jgi:predicted restriction endonuclease
MLTGIIYHTDKDWFNYLIDNNLLNQVNFWTTRSTDLNVDKGSPFFFKTEDKQIVGFADYLDIKHKKTLREAWNQFGPKNGVDSFDKLMEKAKSTLKLKDVDENTKISYIILDNIVAFRNPVPLEDIDHQRMQTYLKIGEDDINKIFQIVSISNRQPDLELKVEPKFTETLVKTRGFQHQLRKKDIEFYGSKCVLCGIDNMDLLNVSHIKPVSLFKEDAGKVENTLLLCSLHDSMFDKGLISIDKDGSIMISGKLEKSQSKRLKEEVEFLSNKRLSAEELHQDFSSEFFEWHRKHIFKSDNVQ